MRGPRLPAEPKSPAGLHLHQVHPLFQGRQVNQFAGSPLEQQGDKPLPRLPTKCSPSPHTVSPEPSQPTPPHLEVLSLHLSGRGCARLQRPQHQDHLRPRRDIPGRSDLSGEGSPAPCANVPRPSTKQDPEATACQPSRPVLVSAHVPLPRPSPPPSQHGVQYQGAPRPSLGLSPLPGCPSSQSAPATPLPCPPQDPLCPH